jgi:hypothetical protein
MSSDSFVIINDIAINQLVLINKMIRLTLSSIAVYVLMKGHFYNGEHFHNRGHFL